jgi:hypothetical protein
VTHCQKLTLSSGDESVTVGVAFGGETVEEGSSGETGNVPEMYREAEEINSSSAASGDTPCEERKVSPRTTRLKMTWEK